MRAIERFFLFIAIIGIAFSIIFVSESHEQQSPANPPGAIAPPGTNYVPPGSIFGQTGITGICNCPYYYENSLLPGIIADTDYLHYYAVQQIVKLPGNRYDHYNYLGAVYVDGSGYVEEWQAPNGGRFDFLHLNAVYPRVVGIPSISGSGPISGLGNVDLTYQAIKGVTPIPPAPPGPPTAIQYYGGLAVGLSGWPTWPQYSNGSSGGPGDAHLCVIYNSLAADWFYRVVTHRNGHAPPKPRAFNFRIWNGYRVSHHLKTISPYSDKTRKRFIWAASQWIHHESLRGIKSKTQWLPKLRVQKTAFRFGILYCWNQYHRCKVVSNR